MNEPRPRPESPEGPRTTAVECDCPADPRIARYFDRRSATRREAGERYQIRAVSRILLEALLAADPGGRSVLELGCGPGALLEKLLLAGAERGTGLDLSPEAIQEALARTTAAGLGDRVTFAAGDAARAPLQLHDWVVLDKVMCCYPDIDSLLANSIPAARSLYAFAVPASYGWRGAVARTYMWVDELVTRLSGRSCPAYVHDLTMIEGKLAAAGFRETARRTRFAWHIAVFERAASAPLGGS